MAETDKHYKSVMVAKDIAEAALQSAAQYRSTRDALRKARMLEALEKEKEEKRRRKEEEQRAVKAKKAEEKRLEKEAKKKMKKDAKEKADKEKGDEVDTQEGQGGKRDKRRRGRGCEEVGEDDLPVLSNQFKGHETMIVDSMGTFIDQITWGRPVIWRARRPPIKKILEAFSESKSAKEATATSALLMSELKGFISTFAQKCEQDPSTVKSTKGNSEEAQVALEALSMEAFVEGALENAINDPDSNTLPNGQAKASNRCIVLDRKQFTDSMHELAESLKKDPQKKDQEQAVQKETMLWNTLHMIGQQHKKTFSGVIQALYAHLIFQIEGTKAMAMAAVNDVIWLLKLEN